MEENLDKFDYMIINVEHLLNGSLALYFKTLQFYNIVVDIKSANGLYYSEPITIEQLDDNYYINGYISELEEYQVCLVYTIKHLPILLL